MADPAAPAADVLSPQDLVAHWQGHRRLTRRVIDAFPEDQLFAFSIGGMRPFGEIAAELLHMGAPSAEGAVTGTWQEYGSKKAPTDKAGLLAAWDEQTARIAELGPRLTAARLAEDDVAFGTFPGKVVDLLRYAVDNEIHHRAQGYVYLRALGVEPPPFWER